MQPLFRSVLTTEFDLLAPPLRRHYDLSPGQEVRVQGEMEAWNRYPWARSVAPFMVMPGRCIPVMVRNRSRIGPDGQAEFEWRREFRHPAGTTTSFTLTRPVAHTMPFRGVLDCFVSDARQPYGVGLTLQVEVADAGQTLIQRTRGPQYLIAGRALIPLPAPFKVDTVAVEKAVPGTEDRIATVVVVSHALLGKLFGYHGVLTIESTSTA